MKIGIPSPSISRHLAMLLSANLALNPAAALEMAKNRGAISPPAKHNIDIQAGDTRFVSRKSDRDAAVASNIGSRAAAPKAGQIRRSHLGRISAVNRSSTFKPETAAFRNAMEILPFRDGAIYELHAAPERITDIQLQPGEVLASVASGDTARWIIGDTVSGSGEDKQVHILVKPFAANLSTNLLITTDRRSYHLNLKSNPTVGTAAISWIYPADDLMALTGVPHPQSPASAAGRIRPEQLNFDYSISGARPRWRPVRAFDDGQKTYIEFPPAIETDEAPPLFLVSGREAQLVNYRMQGRFYIVDRLFDKAELRLGTKHAVIVGISRANPARLSTRP